MRIGLHPKPRRSAAALWFAFAFLACKAPPADAPAPAEVDAGATSLADAAAIGSNGESSGLTADAGHAAGDAAAPPKPLRVVARAVFDAASRELAVDGLNQVIEPQSRFELELPRLADVRVRLFDESDRAIASHDRMVVGETVRYAILPAEPLVSGSRYSLVIDGLRAELATDDDGQQFRVVPIELATSGEKPPPPPKPTKKRRSKRR